MAMCGMLWRIVCTPPTNWIERSRPRSKRSDAARRAFGLSDSKSRSASWPNNPNPSRSTVDRPTLLRLSQSLTPLPIVHA